MIFKVTNIFCLADNSVFGPSYLSELLEGYPVNSRIEGKEEADRLRSKLIAVARALKV